MKPAMNQNNGSAHVNARMHRPSIVDDEACAPEGLAVHMDAYDYNRNTTQACCRDLNSGRGPDCPEHPRRSAPDWAVWLILGASIMGTLLIIHFGVQA